MQRDCTRWARACLGCQRAKVGRYTRTPVGRFPTAKRFAHIHVDIVGPLPPSNGKDYCVTVIDRTTGWPEAIPTSNTTAPAVAEILITHWFSHFGIPAYITSDQGRQFESNLFNALTDLLSAKHIRTTRFHPCSNGKVERWHRSLKSAIMAHATKKWVKVLPLVLLGLRSAIGADGTSAAQRTFGTELRLPGDFFSAKEVLDLEDAPEFVRQLKEAMRSFADLETRRHGIPPVFVPRELKSATHVFVRQEPIRKGLQPPFHGPYKIVRRHEGDKFITVQLDDGPEIISMDDVKPAFKLADPNPSDKKERLVKPREIQLRTRKVTFL